jgi:hypothetical protein
VPLFVSYSRLRVYKTLPKAKSTWALDSGAFSELLRNGRWTISTPEYAGVVRRFQEQVGRLEWASIQDWICSPAAIQRTGLEITEHQERTIESLRKLRHLAPEISWLPVLQGWNVKSYMTHLRMYQRNGFQLETEALVGVGSLAIRQESEDIVRVLAALRAEGIKTHAFGLSLLGLQRVKDFIESADSMVWSFTARRRRIKLRTCRASHIVCNNCLKYALAWRRHVLNRLASVPGETS